MIALEHLHSLLSYNPQTGVISWRVARGTRARAGVTAGCLDPQGYRVIGIDNRAFLAHRLAWALATGAWPCGEIDHINGNKSDNRFCNLRIATSAQNKMNRGKYKGSLLKGVAKTGNRFRGYITINGVRKHLGSYPTQELAHAAYCEAAQKAFGAYHRAE